MKRRTFLKSSIGIGLGWSGISAQSHEASDVGLAEKERIVPGTDQVNSDKPHIILIMTDQQRGDALVCIGNKAEKTPNLDRLSS